MTLSLTKLSFHRNRVHNQCVVPSLGLARNSPPHSEGFFNLGRKSFYFLGYVRKFVKGKLRHSISFNENVSFATHTLDFVCIRYLLPTLPYTVQRFVDHTPGPGYEFSMNDYFCSIAHHFDNFRPCIKMDFARNQSCWRLRFRLAIRNAIVWIQKQPICLPDTK